MSLLWLQPLALLALAAVLVPVLAHLRRATQATRVDFAALRWLPPRRRPRRRLRVRDWLLLALRMVLVAALATLLAIPARIDRGAAPDQVFVAPALTAAQAHAAWPSLPATAQWHWLAAGFPDLAAPPPRAHHSTSLASLLREADARAPAGAALHVIVPATVDGLDGARPRIGHRVDWRVAPAPAPAPPPRTEAAPARAAPLLALRGDDAAARAILRAVAVAWAPVASAAGDARPHAAAAPQFAVAPLAAPLPPRDARLVWLAARAPPALQDWVADGGTALLVPPPGAQPASLGHPQRDDATRVAVWRRADGSVLADAVALGRGRLLRLHAPLRADALPESRDPEFPRQLARLFDGPPPAPTRGPADALRPAPGGPRFATPPTPLAPAWTLAIACLFVVERLLATRARSEGDR